MLSFSRGKYSLQKKVAPNTPQFNPVETVYCLTGAFFNTAIVAPVVAPAKAKFNYSVQEPPANKHFVPVMLEPSNTLFAVSVLLLILTV